MSADVDSGSNAGIYTRIEESLRELRAEQNHRFTRIEDQLERRRAIDDELRRSDSAKVDGIKSDLDSLRGELRGSIGMLKWLGPTGVVALIAGLVKAAGLL